MQTRSSNWRTWRREAIAWAACGLLAANLEAASPLDLGAAAANGFLGGRFDSKGALKDNAVQPLQGKQQMTDQTGKSFDANIQCAQAVPMLEVFGAPGPTGDLSTVVMQADLDLDNTFDLSVSPAKPVSGVCANGFITCTPGTWKDCEGWTWAATTSTLGAVPANIRSLKGCYCINNACGSSLVWTNLDLILRDLGTAAVHAIQQVRADYVISDVNSNPAQVRFYGAEGAGCRSGSPGQQAYLGNSSLMNTDLANEVTAQTGDPTSLYSVVTTSPAATASAVTNNSCVIDRQVPVSDADCSIQPDVVSNSCTTYTTNPNCKLKSEDIDGVSTYTNFQPTGLIPLPTERSVSSPSGFAPLPEDLYYDLSSIHYAYAETNTTFLTVIGMTVNVRYSRTGCVKDTNFGFYAGTNTIWVSGGCRANFKVTGLIPKPCAHQVTRDWWTKQQVWQCQSVPPAFTFDDGLHRADVATSTADLQTGFTETHKDASGNWVSQSVNLGEPAQLPVVDSCEPVCKLSQTVNDDQLNPMNLSKPNRTAPGTRTVYRYAVCINNACPSRPGETIVKNCQCLDDFTEAATIMQLLRQAGQDLLCQPPVTSNLP